MERTSVLAYENRAAALHLAYGLDLHLRATRVIKLLQTDVRRLAMLRTRPPP